MGMDGATIYFPEATTDVFCVMDVTYFPFDEQNCTMLFRIQGVTSDKVMIVPYHLGYNLYRFEVNEEWDLAQISYLIFDDCIDGKCYAAVIS